jgi:hypothetical protein
LLRKEPAGRKPAVKRGVVAAMAAAATAMAAAPAAHAIYYEDICSTNGTYVTPGDHCPYNPNGHTWVYNEVWRSNQGDYDQPFYERVYHGDTANGELLSNRVHYGNGYVDSGADLTGGVAGWTKRAFATNGSTWANMTLWGQAHTA